MRVFVCQHCRGQGCQIYKPEGTVHKRGRPRSSEEYHFDKERLCYCHKDSPIQYSVKECWHYVQNSHTRKCVLSGMNIIYYEYLRPGYHLFWLVLLFFPQIKRNMHEVNLQLKASSNGKTHSVYQSPEKANRLMIEGLVTRLITRSFSGHWREKIFILPNSYFIYFFFWICTISVCFFIRYAACL